MLDIKFIRENKDLVKKSCQSRRINVDIDKILDADIRYRENLRAMEDMQAQKNKASREITQAKDEHEKKKIILEMQELDKNNDRLGGTVKELENELKRLIFQVPNIPFGDVPLGNSDAENVVVKEIGQKPKFNFQPKDHTDIGELLDIIDIKRAAKISGTRFSFLKNEAVLVELALLDLTVRLLIKEKFTPLIPPVLLKSEMAKGTGYLEATGEEEAYFLPKDDLYLVGTSEQPILTMHSNEVFDQKELPKRYFAFSTCFRRESGSYGKDTKGILRVHQFNKLEMFSFCNPEDSQKEHIFLREIEEKIMNLLKLPYRVVQLCVGDLGFPSAKTFDIETWMPSENKYRETHSASNCTDFQSRRLNIKYRDSKTGELKFVHALNATGFTERLLIAILENYQQKDGSVKVPTILQKYTKFKIIKK